MISRALERQLEMATRMRDHDAASLAEYMRGLASTLDREAQRIEDALEVGLQPKSPNSIGMLQGTGSHIDALCGALAARNDTVAAVQYLVDKGQEEAA